MLSSYDIMTLLKSKTQQQENDYNVFFVCMYDAILLHEGNQNLQSLPFQHISNCKNNNNDVVDDDDDDCKL